MQDLFEATLVLEGDARPAYLERACHGDAGLNAEVASLLRAAGTLGPADALVDEPVHILPTAPERLRRRLRHLSVSRTLNNWAT